MYVLFAGNVFILTHSLLLRVSTRSFSKQIVQQIKNILLERPKGNHVGDTPGCDTAGFSVSSTRPKVHHTCVSFHHDTMVNVGRLGLNERQHRDIWAQDETALRNHHHGWARATLAAFPDPDIAAKSVALFDAVLAKGTKKIPGNDLRASVSEMVQFQVHDDRRSARSNALKKDCKAWHENRSIGKRKCEARMGGVGSPG